MQRFLTIAGVTVFGGLCAGCAIVPTGADQARIINDVLNSPAALVAIFAAMLAFLSGVLGPLVAGHVGRKQAAASQRSADAVMLIARTAGARELAKLRMAWMEALRNKLSEYHSVLVNFKDDDRTTDPVTKIEEDRKLSELVTHLDLLLNQHDPLQKALWNISDQIHKTAGPAERGALDEPLIQAGRVVLQAEWEKVKAEMQGGPFQSGIPAYPAPSSLLAWATLRHQQPSPPPSDRQAAVGPPTLGQGAEQSLFMRE
jgi:hypothetical protein